MKTSCLLLGLLLVAAWSSAKGLAQDKPKKTHPTTGGIEVLDPWLHLLIDPQAKIEVLADGLAWSEGPVWIQDGNYLLCSDIPNNRIVKWSEAEGKTTYLQPSGDTASDRRGGESGSNGLLLDGQGRLKTKTSLEDFIRANVATKKEIDVFLHEMSWAQFDPVVGYVLGNYMPRDGIDGSCTLSTAEANGARTSFMYKDRPCRINTYGNSFTQCHQVSDGETWQEYLAAHLGEPIRNFGMGGFGVYQAYRRMVREEQTENGAEPYVMLYIWGDDHIRSLFRCRYMATASWNRRQYDEEGTGRMFHGNFWSNMEMNLTTGELKEHDSRISNPEELYRMTDPDWMVENLKDDLALEMSLYCRGRIDVIEVAGLKQLSRGLNRPLDLDQKPLPRTTVASLLDAYSFAATKAILKKARAFTKERGKKLMVILLDPYRVTRALLEGGTRYDQEIVDFLEENEFTVFDMNLVHMQDYKNFRPSVDDYFKRYFIGHYSPRGNHFFAYSLKRRVVDWLVPKPLPYRDTPEKVIDFQGYLQGLQSK